LNTFKQQIENQMKIKEECTFNNQDNKKTFKWKVSLFSVEETNHKLSQHSNQVEESFVNERVIMINVKENFADNRLFALTFNSFFEQFKSTMQNINQLTVNKQQQVNGNKLNSIKSNMKKKVILIVYVMLDIGNNQSELDDEEVKNINFHFLHFELSNNQPKIVNIETKAKEIVKTIWKESQLLIKKTN
jgi:hypothetical protein